MLLVQQQKEEGDCRVFKRFTSVIRSPNLSGHGGMGPSPGLRNRVKALCCPGEIQLSILNVCGVGVRIKLNVIQVSFLLREQDTGRANSP